MNYSDPTGLSTCITYIERVRGDITSLPGTDVRKETPGYDVVRTVCFGGPGQPNYPTIGPSTGGGSGGGGGTATSTPPQTVGPNQCYVAATGAAFAVVTDIGVVTGGLLAAKAAYYGGKGVVVGAQMVLQRLALEQVNATHLLSGNPLSGRGKLAAGALSLTGQSINATLATGSFDWRGLLQGLVPGWNSYNAITAARRHCGI